MKGFYMHAASKLYYFVGIIFLYSSIAHSMDNRKPQQKEVDPGSQEYQETIRKMHQSIKYSIPPYAEIGAVLALRHATWEHTNGIRKQKPLQKDSLDLILNTPIAHPDYGSMYVNAFALHLLCQEYDIQNPNERSLALALPHWLTIKIEHPGGDNCWFLASHVRNFFPLLQLQKTPQEIADDPFGDE